MQLPTLPVELWQQWRWRQEVMLLPELLQLQLWPL